MFGDSLDKKIFKIIEKDEKSHGLNTISAMDLLTLARNRYILMKEILKPLVLELSKELLITNIYFINDLNENFSIDIEYRKDNKLGYLILKQTDFNEFEVILNTDNSQDNKLINKNKKIIIQTFKYGLEKDFDKKSELSSTSDLLSLSIYNNLYEMHNKEVQNFDNYFKLSSSLDSKELLESVKLYSSSNIQSKFNLENLKMFLQHVKFYEKDIPKYLLKK